MPPELKLIGDRIRLRRKEAGLTVTALAEKANMDKGQVSRIESGEQSLRVETVLRLAGVLHTKVGWIIANEGEPGPVPIFKDGHDKRRRKPNGE